MDQLKKEYIESTYARKIAYHGVLNAKEKFKNAILAEKNAKKAFKKVLIEEISKNEDDE